METSVRVVGTRIWPWSLSGIAVIVPAEKSSVRNAVAAQLDLNSVSATLEPASATWSTRSSANSRISAVQEGANQPSGKATMLGAVVSARPNITNAYLTVLAEASVARART